MPRIKFYRQVKYYLAKLDFDHFECIFFVYKRKKLQKTQPYDSSREIAICHSTTFNSVES